MLRALFGFVNLDGEITRRRRVSGRVLPVLRLEVRRQSQPRRMLTFDDILRKFFRVVPRRRLTLVDECSRLLTLDGGGGVAARRPAPCSTFRENQQKPRYAAGKAKKSQGGRAPKAKESQPGGAQKANKSQAKPMKAKSAELGPGGSRVARTWGGPDWRAPRAVASGAREVRVRPGNVRVCPEMSTFVYECLRDSGRGRAGKGAAHPGDRAVPSALSYR